MEEIRRILMERDGMSETEADALIEEARNALQKYIDNDELMLASDICNEYFGLEPDYLEELL